MPEVPPLAATEGGDMNIRVAELTTTLTRLVEIAEEGENVVQTICLQQATGTEVCAECQARNYCQVRDLGRLLGMEGKL
jgi:hypothetical protein